MPLRRRYQRRGLSECGGIVRAALVLRPWPLPAWVPVPIPSPLPTHAPWISGHCGPGPSVMWRGGVCGDEGEGYPAAGGTLLSRAVDARECPPMSPEVSGLGPGLGPASRVLASGEAVNSPVCPVLPSGKSSRGQCWRTEKGLNEQSHKPAEPVSV
jgi:hypothetical protein